MLSFVKSCVWATLYPRLDTNPIPEWPPCKAAGPAVCDVVAAHGPVEVEYRETAERGLLWKVRTWGYLHEFSTGLVALGAAAFQGPASQASSRYEHQVIAVAHASLWMVRHGGDTMEQGWSCHRHAWYSVSRLLENIKVHEQYWEQLAGLDREETAARARCTYLAERDSFAISLLNSQYVVDPCARTACMTVEASSPRPAGFLEQLCILAYLVNARDLPLADKLVSAGKLDPGGFFFRGSHRLAVEKLEDAFGREPQWLHKVGRLFDATPKPFGDASIEVSVLPRIPLTFIIWAADMEFPARASILFDQSASAHLPLDVVYAAATLAIETVVNTAKSIT